MKHSICLAFLIFCCFISSFAQDCDLKLNTAQDYKAKNDYKNAIEWYKSVLSDCGDYDGNVLKELKECEKKITNRNAVFLLEQSLLECSGEGGTFVMELKKAPVSWSVSEVPEWLQVTSDTLEEKKVEFTATANPNAAIRLGAIKLTSDKGVTQEFTVIQHEGEERLTVQTDNLAFAGNGGQETVTVDANFRWSYNSSAPWLHVSQQKNTLSITCLANELVLKRNATITISGKKASQTIQVIQFEGDTRFSISGVSDSTISFDAAGGENNMLKINCNDTWQVKNNCPWLNIVSSDSTLAVHCDANPWAEQRTASFKLVTTFERQEKTILVKQGGAAPKIDRIALPSSGGERNVSSVRPHFRSVFLKGNKGDMKVKIHTNVQNWEYRILFNEENWITAEAFQKDSLLKLTLSDNNGWKVRESNIIFSAMGIQDTLNIRQNKRGYRGIIDDYFEGDERVWKTSRFFVDVFAAQSTGFRIGGLSKRWKFVEFSLLDFSVEFDYNRSDKLFNINWEPIVRGYLPLSRSGNRWAVFIGMGPSVKMFSLDVAPTDFRYFNVVNFLFEIGAEFHWLKKDNLSSRIFYRYNGYSSVGFSFDFYKWTKKYGINQ